MGLLCSVSAGRMSGRFFDVGGVRTIAAPYVGV